MAIVPLSSDHVEVVTLVANPKRTFSSSSISGPTGSVPIFVRSSPSEKEAKPLANFRISAFEEPNAEERARLRGWISHHNDNLGAMSKDSGQAALLSDPFDAGDGKSIETEWAALVDYTNQSVGAEATLQITEYNYIQAGDRVTVESTDGTLHIFEFTDDPPASPTLDPPNISYVSRGLFNNNAAAATALSQHIGATSPNPVEKSSNGKYFTISGLSYGSSGQPATITIKQGIPGSDGNNATISFTSLLPDGGINVLNEFGSGDKGGQKIAPDVHDQLDDLMNRINTLGPSPRRQKSVEITRFQPSFKFSKNTGRKNTVKNILMPYYRKHHRGMHWAFSNYHCLNFFTSSGTPSDTVMIYKAGYGSNSSKSGEFRYCPSQSFTFDFYINPKYTTDTINDEFHAGTILHMSSCYAVSLVTGSSRDLNDVPNGYRILLQLSHSAEVLPSDVDLSWTNNTRLRDSVHLGIVDDDAHGHGDLIFLSADNSLRKNHWHHVSIRWGGPNVNQGTGSFYIDGEPSAYFCVPSSSIMDPTETTDVRSGSDALFVGNFWEGTNSPGTDGDPNHDFPSRFFNYGAHIQHGVTTWEDDAMMSHGSENPYGFSFDHPLNAEVHDLKIYNSYRSIEQLVTGSRQGPINIEQDLIFYVPPYFVKESRQRQVLQTPFHETTGSTNDPFNVALSFGVGGHYLNLENYTREFVEKDYPLLYNLSASTIEVQTDARPADYWIHNPPGVDFPGARKRNLSVLPCDNGKFTPGFILLRSGAVMDSPSHDISGKKLTLYDDFVKAAVGANYPTALSGSETDKFVNDFGQIDYSLVTLDNLVGLPTFISTDVTITAPYMTSSYVTPIWIEPKIDPNTGQPYPGYNVGDQADPDDPFYNEATAKWVGELAPNALDENLDPKVISNESIMQSVVSALPEDPGIGSGLGGRLTILERTRDPSSNEVTFFDISNMFYGNRIYPKSFFIVDEALTGSDGKVKISLRDNGHGLLYRADAETPHADWSNIGNIFYNDGLAVVKTPNIPNFGKHQFETSFSGEHVMHVYQVSVPCPKGMINSSSNPAFKSMKPTDYLSEYNDDFVYITGINLHDENLNVVARANLAQPVAKRNTDHYLFKIKLDY